MKNLFGYFLILILLLNVKTESHGFGDNHSGKRIEDTLTVDGRIRSYILNLPAEYEESINIPLVIFLHGGGGNASQAEKDYNFTDNANKEGFAVVYPDGMKGKRLFNLRFWNAGSCCKDASENEVDDVKFIRLLIDELLKKYPGLNSKQVYATGMSNGAMMCYRLAAELSDKIAAVAPVSGTMMIQKNNPVRAVPILHIHSLKDEKVPYQGGRGIGKYDYTPVDVALKTWVTLNKCNPEAIVLSDNEKFIHEKWVDHDENTIIECYKTKDGGHSWPGGKKARFLADKPSQAFSANNIIWDFLKKYRLP